MKTLLGAILKGKKILVVEDDAALRDVICRVMKADGADVLAAEGGESAKATIERLGGNFDLIVSDVNMPGMNGVELLKYVKANFPKISFFVVTGFSDILEAQAAYDLGADGFLAKPFHLVDLRNALLKALPRKGGVANPEREFVFCKIHIDEFLATSRLISDIYVQVGDKKYVKVAREGTEIQVRRIHNYKEKNIEFFYVAAEDFNKYTGMNFKGPEALAKETPEEKAAKAELVSLSRKLLVERVLVAGLSPHLREEAETLLTNTLSMLVEVPAFFKALSWIQTTNDRTYLHSVSVAAYASLLARKIGWVSLQTQYKLSTASLFHEIGFGEIPVYLPSKPMGQMTAEEIDLYQSHVIRGRDYLLALPGFPWELTQIAFQSRENQNGTGYPLGISGQKIHPLAKVLRVAGEFADCLLNSETSTLQEAQEIVKEIYLSKNRQFEPEYLGALFEVVDLERPLELSKR